jgi:3-deoxy-D-manno-octulosonic-acid transferase
MLPLPTLPPPHRDPFWLGYRACLLLLAPVWGSYAAWRLLAGNSRSGRGERLGGGRTLPPPPPAPGLRAWFHGVSVGETEAMAPVIRAFETLARARGIRAEVVVSATTPTGRSRVDALHPRVVERRFTPIDLPWTTSRAFRRIRPHLLVLGESELWPALLERGARQGGVVVVNARISDRTYPRARRLRPFYRWMLRRVAALGVQTPEDRERFVALGMPPERVQVTGNTKFDRRVETPSPEEAARLRHDLGVGSAPLVVAGSTFPGEDALLLDALGALPSEARLILAPRHPERGDEVEALVRERGIPVHRRSRGAWSAPSDAPGPRVVVLDTVGELARVYALATVAVVGRSFRTGGGQNPLEPLAHGVPVVYGPRMENFREIAALAEAAGAAVRVQEEAALAPTLAALFADPEARRRRGEAGRALLETHGGAAERSARLLLEVGGYPSAGESHDASIGGHAGPGNAGGETALQGIAPHGTRDPEPGAHPRHTPDLGPDPRSRQSPEPGSPPQPGSPPWPHPPSPASFAFPPWR